MGLENLKSNKGLVQKPKPIPEKISTIEPKKSIFGQNNLTSITEINKMSSGTNNLVSNTEINRMTSGTNNLESSIFPNKMKSGTNNLTSPVSTIFIGNGLAKHK